MPVSISACFNPRAREGRDGRPWPSSRATRCFNPRAREGRDRGPDARRRQWAGFNPRAREGRDLARSAAYLYKVVFQSTRP